MTFIKIHPLYVYIVNEYLVKFYQTESDISHKPRTMTLRVRSGGKEIKVTGDRGRNFTRGSIGMFVFVFHFFFFEELTNQERSATLPQNKCSSTFFNVRKLSVQITFLSE